MTMQLLGHIGHPTDGFLQGLLHPVTGLDHLLAMLAVGMLAAQAGGRALWALPAVFVGLMAAGGAVAAVGVGLPGVELAIAASVVVFGAMLAWRRVDLPTATVLVGLFAMFHGHAHVTEIAAGASAAGYVGGFLIATALLHAVGAAVILAVSQPARPAVVRIGGAAVALAGLLIAGGVL